jgi:Leucine-rich repeat (LRR) protein
MCCNWNKGENKETNNSVMKKLLIVLLLLLASGLSLFSQGNQKSADELKKEMAQIRRSTNWGNEQEAKEADAKIQELSKQLMMVNKLQQQQKSGATVDSAKIKEEVDYKMQLWGQMMKSVDQGKSGDIFLADPLREEIVEAYKDDESPKNIRPEYLQEMSVLVIDMSVPTVQRIIEQMQNFKSIKTLIITGGDHGAPVDLNDLLMRATAYPLQTLNIINFHQFVSSIPDKLNHFESLTTLGLFNNNISQLPDLSGVGTHLDSLYVDINPISTLYPVIERMPNLKKLGVAKTSISEAEIRRIEQLLPKCQIITR